MCWTHLLSSSSREFFFGWYFFDKFLWKQFRYLSLIPRQLMRDSMLSLCWYKICAVWKEAKTRCTVHVDVTVSSYLASTVMIISVLCFGNCCVAWICITWVSLKWCRTLASRLCGRSVWWFLCQQSVIICTMFWIWAHAVYLCFQDLLSN